MPMIDMLKKWFEGMVGGNHPVPQPTWVRPTKSPFSPRPEPNTEPHSAEPNLLYTIKWSESTEGMKECGGEDVLRCYVIDINPAALGADTISVTEPHWREPKGNTFTIPKKSSDNRPGAIYYGVNTYANLKWRSENISDGKAGLGHGAG